MSGKGEPVAGAFEALLTEFEPLEAFTRLDRSALWSINSSYWRKSGNAAFLRDAVPFQATSDGTLSAAAAQFAAAWAQARAAGGLPARRMLFIEFGPGSGLFARGLIRRYRALAEAETALPTCDYLSIDVAGSMQADIEANGILDLPGLVPRFVELDLGSELERLAGVIAAERREGTLILAICNYVLDSVPARHFRRDGGLKELEVQVCRTPGSDAARLDTAGLVTRQRYVVCDADDAAARFAGEFAVGEGDQLTLNTGAMDCIDVLCRALGEDGLILVNDYPIETHVGEGQAWQAFGGSVASGLHFASLDRYVEAAGASSVAAQRPATFITSRLIGAPSAELSAAYRQMFSMDAARFAHGHVAAARAAHTAGRHGEATAAYQEAVTAQPANWSLLVEAAGFTLTALNRPAEAQVMLGAALEENPLSVVGWNLMGDCRFAGGEIDEAEDHYRHAQTISGGDARALLNLAYCAGRRNDLEEALIWVARALAREAGGPLTDEILRRQAEIIGQLSSGGEAGTAGPPKPTPLPDEISVPHSELTAVHRP